MTATTDVTTPPCNDATRWVRRVRLVPPSLADNTADADRLIRALQPQTGGHFIEIPLSLLQDLPGRLRQADYRVDCLLIEDRGHHLLTHVAAAAADAPLAGLAVDLGTTRIAAQLVDLRNGQSLAEAAVDNPQLTVGPDVLVRIHHSQSPQGRAALQRQAAEGINRAVTDLCAQTALTPDAIALMVVAGNTAMTHLLLGLDARWLIREPYIPAANQPGMIRARDLGIAIHNRARILVFPNVGSYFGGDLIAGILYAGLHRRSDTAILVDVGTNAEVVLGNRDWMIACAGAAGPALEGGMSRMGMLAGPGVIDRVRIGPAGDLRLGTIGNEAPRGICGSGVIDLAAQLFRNGWVDIRGRLLPERCHGRCREVDGQLHLDLVAAADAANGETLSIGQADLDSLMRSKAAMYTILETLTGQVGLTPEQLTTFYVAGTFGCFIDPESAVTIGMLPDLPRERYHALGNSALGGAVRLLSDTGAQAEIRQIQANITYLELNVNQDFMNRFSAAKFLPHTDRQRFPSIPSTAGNDA
ncbi:MAG: ASKHA domain-containing protein [Desulfosarcinaceae bacterium]|nr:ASKHA domain-containing protein [Desulfosarcinaceae bacterium]